LKNLEQNNEQGITESLFAKLKNLFACLESYDADISQIANLNTTFARELLTATEETAVFLRNNSEELSDLTSAAFQMKERIERSDHLLKEGLEAAQKNTEAIDFAAARLNLLQKHFNDVRKTIQEISSSLNGINNKILSIEDLSSLTDLLALNAAVEAARAGEAGKGFAVVAKEIRSLADRSRHATEEITLQLRKLNGQVKETIKDIQSYDDLQGQVREELQITGKTLSSSIHGISTVKEEFSKISLGIFEECEKTSRIAERINGQVSKAKIMADSSGYILSSLEYQKDLSQDLVNYIASEEEEIESLKSAYIIEDLYEDVVKRVVFAGHDSAYPPWTFLQKGIPQGISIDSFKRLTASLGYSPELLSGQWSSLFPALLEGKLDCLLNAGWPNSFFDNQPVIPSLPYAAFQVRIFMHKGLVKERLPLKPSFFAGKRVAAQRGSYVRTYIEPFGAEVLEYDNDIQGMISHIWGKTAAIITEERVGKYLSKRFFREDIIPVTESLGQLDVVMLFHRNSEQLRNTFNGGLERIAGGGALPSGKQNAPVGA